jgi:hypothetical protein
MRHPGALILLTAIGCGTEETCDDWYCQDGTNTATAGTDSKASGTKSTETKTGTAGAFNIAGLVDANTGLGTIVLTGFDCVSTLPISEAVQADDCTNCDFAHAMTLGALDAAAMPCDGDDVMAGLVMEVGHADPNELWSYKVGGGWVSDESGTSTVNGDSWEFSFK